MSAEPRSLPASLQADAHLEKAFHVAELTTAIAPHCGTGEVTPNTEDGRGEERELRDRDLLVAEGDLCAREPAPARDRAEGDAPGRLRGGRHGVIVEQAA